MPRGGKREGAGRKPGKPNRPKFDIQAEAEKRAEKALKVFDDIFASKKVSPLTRLSAADKILDRAFGKPVQSTQMLDPNGDVVAPVLVQIVAATPADVAKAQADPGDDDGEEQGD
jgi:hypothetical protein